MSRSLPIVFALALFLLPLPAEAQVRTLRDRKLESENAALKRQLEKDRDCCRE